MQAARLVLDDLIVPVRKGRLIRLDLPAIESAADVLTALSDRRQRVARMGGMA